MSFQLLLASDRLFFTLLLKHHEARPIPEQIPLYNRIQVQAERPNRPAQPVMTFAYSCEKCRTGVEQDILNIFGLVESCTESTLRLSVFFTLLSFFVDWIKDFFSLVLFYKRIFMIGSLIA